MAHGHASTSLARSVFVICLWVGACVGVCVCGLRGLEFSMGDVKKGERSLSGCVRCRFLATFERGAPDSGPPHVNGEDLGGDLATMRWGLGTHAAMPF